MRQRVDRIHVVGQVIERQILVVIPLIHRRIDLVLRLPLKQRTRRAKLINIRQVGLTCQRRGGGGLLLQLTLLLVVSAIDLRGELIHLVVLDRDGRLKVSS